ncbi:hypothetical protein Sjap_008432 [Stephania japonica]|uniref:Uncharacterized protein n=1 Tax=Stephania japonica TaxID=461633 RepID=A0AAP0JR30_9MAGN
MDERNQYMSNQWAMSRNMHRRFFFLSASITCFNNIIFLRPIEYAYKHIPEKVSFSSVLYLMELLYTRARCTVIFLTSFDYIS